MQDTSRFFKVYSNLPMNVRKEIVLVINDQPISWTVAHNEIANKTEVGKKILRVKQQRKHMRDPNQNLIIG